MSRLRVYNDDRPDGAETIEDHDAIARALAGIGVRFERWSANADLPAGATQDDVIAAYRDDVDRLMKESGFQSVDVIALTPDNPKKAELRTKFLDEHTHAEFEIRFFVDGSGQFNLHKEGKVFEVVCEKGDLISVPDGTPHWFDMGPEPSFKCIRFFTNPEGWVAQFTGSDIASRYPRFGVTAWPKAILTDIEGTTSSIAFVKETLFPYARARIGAFCRAHADDPEVAAQLAAARGDDPLDLDGVVARLEQWIDEDRKATPLKALQGLIWRAGYLEGAYQGHIYPDAVEGLRGWHARGIPLFVYSSGSVAAQKLLFGHSVAGDLTPLFSGYFDTTSGPKKEADSYRRIADAIRGSHEVAAAEVLFLSDVAAELDAARAAGLDTLRLVRPEDGTPPGSDHREVATFADIAV